jgi:hypothetical protein
MSFFFNQKKWRWRAVKQPARHLNILLTVLGLACLGALYFLIALSPVTSKSKARDIVVVVPQQSTATQVGQILKGHELIHSPFVFVLYARWKNLDGSLKAGEYLLNNGLSTPEMLNELVEGRLASETITIPEGFTMTQVAELLETKGLAEREEFFAVAAREDFSYKFLEERPKGERRLEGYLFPDTYRVTRGDSVRFLIDNMLKRFDLDEYRIEELKKRGAKIDMWGIGTRVITCYDDPALGGIYKLVAKETNGSYQPVIKISGSFEKVTTPGVKTIYRMLDKSTGWSEGDYIAFIDENIRSGDQSAMFNPDRFEAIEMLVPVFSGGKQVYQLPSLDEIRSYHKKQLAMFRPEYLRKDNPETYSVYLSDHVKNTKMALLRQHNQNFHEDTEAEVIETS